MGWIQKVFEINAYPRKRRDRGNSSYIDYCSTECNPKKINDLRVLSLLTSKVRTHTGSQGSDKAVPKLTGALFILLSTAVGPYRRAQLLGGYVSPGLQLIPSCSRQLTPPKGSGSGNLKSLHSSRDRKSTRHQKVRR